MQLSVLFSALVSLAILVTALPTPEAILKHSSNRENLDIDFQLHRSVEGKLDEFEDGYLGYDEYGEVPESTSRAIEERREELESELLGYTYIGYIAGGGGSSTSRAIEE
ncbi:hypothetical protein BDR04DRAFT_1119384 [Suillus decipiens]|nr:hypothetical protein BDR04DRAFT_1119384 [Suillus decipiens]